MALSEEEIKLVHELRDAGLKKGYHMEALEILIMLSHTTKLSERNINPDMALKKIIEIVKASVDEEEGLTKACDFVDGV